MRPDGIVFLLGPGALRPVLEGNEEEGVVGGVGLAEHVEADDRGIVFDPRGVLQNLLHLAGRRLGTLQGGHVGKLQGAEEIALVLVGQEAHGQVPAQAPGDDGEPQQEDHADRALADQDRAKAHVAVIGLAENLVEAVVELLQGTRSPLPRLQQQGGEGRTQGQ